MQAVKIEKVVSSCVAHKYPVQYESDGKNS